MRLLVKFLKKLGRLLLFFLQIGLYLFFIYWIELFHYLGSSFPYLVIFVLPPLLYGWLSRKPLKKILFFGSLPLATALIIYAVYVRIFSGSQRFGGWLLDMGFLLIAYGLASFLTLCFGFLLKQSKKTLGIGGISVLFLLIIGMTYSQFHSANYDNYYYIGEGLLGNIGMDINAKEETREKALQMLCQYLEQKYPYFDYKKIDWTHIKKRAFDDLIRVESDTGYYRLLETMLNELQDGHIRLRSPEIRRQNQSKVSLGARFVDIDGKLVIAKITPGSNAEKVGLTPGLELDKVNNKSIAEALASVPDNLISAKDNTIKGKRSGWRQRLFYLLYQPVGTVMDLDLLDIEGMECHFRIQYDEIKEERFVSPPAISQETLSDNIGYIQIRRFSVDPILFVSSFDQVLDDLWHTKGLIIDIRGNSGGAIIETDQIVGRFTDELVNYGGILNRQGKLGRLYVVPRRPFYDKKVVLLIDERNASAAEFFAYAASHLERITLVGRPTAGIVSSPSRSIQMPGGITVDLVASGLADPTGRYVVEWVGVQPDVYVSYEKNALKNGIDRDLETAIEIIDKL